MEGWKEGWGWAEWGGGGSWVRSAARTASVVSGRRGGLEKGRGPQLCEMKARWCVGMECELVGVLWQVKRGAQRRAAETGGNQNSRRGGGPSPTQFSPNPLAPRHSRREGAGRSACTFSLEWCGKETLSDTPCPLVARALGARTRWNEATHAHATR